MLVKDVMVKEVVTLKPEDTIREASKKFAENNISGAPVVNNEKNVVGILSEADILKMLEVRYTRGGVVFLPTPFDLIEIPFMEAVREAEIYKGAKDMLKDLHDYSKEDPDNKDIEEAQRWLMKVYPDIRY